MKRLIGWRLLAAQALLIASQRQVFSAPPPTASADGDTLPSAPEELATLQLPAVSGTPVTVPSGADLQTAIDSAGAGARLVLAGRYAVNHLRLKTGVNLVGPATIDGAVEGSGICDVHLDRLTFHGRVSTSGGVKNVWLTRCRFDVAEQKNAIVFYDGGADIHVVGNTIEHASDIGLLGWALRHSDISYNLLQNSSEHLHLFWGASGPDHPDVVTIAHNIFRRSKRYTMELQGGPNTLEVAHNWIGDWLADDLRNYCLSTTLSIATGGHGKRTTSYRVTVHDNIVGYFPPNPPISHKCGGIGSPYELMGGDIEGWHNIEFGRWSGGPLAGWTHPQWKWHDNVKVGSDLDAYPSPAGEAGYHAPAPGNYVNNKTLPDDSVKCPRMTWAYTNEPIP